MKLDRSQAIYVLYNPSLNITKIGISDNVDKRRRELQGASGCELLLHYNTGHVFNAEIYESKAHEILASKRKIGEWFNCTPEEATETVKLIIKEATNDPIVEAYMKGDSISGIAQEHNVTRQAIIAKLRYYGYHGSIVESTCNANNKGWRKYGEIEPITRIETIKDMPKTEKDHIVVETNTFLDDNKPHLPITGLKRIEPNLNFNGEWYQTSTYKGGAFFHAYTKDIEKARDYIRKAK